VKTAFPTGAGADEFGAIVEACFVPVIVLGGAAMGDDRALLEMVRKAIDAGAAGIAVGRNVWQHPHPAKVAKALHAVVHDDALEGITHVTRGQDLFHATSIHRVLQSILELPQPVYIHHRLIPDETGRKLSKSAGDRSLASLREAGITAEEIRSELGF
jgi:hypothetical protein